MNELKRNFKGLNIAVIGDMMLDGYFQGDVKRISPEAPVPVVEVGSEFFRFGGAANVALNIQKLGGISLPVGVIGYDNDGTIFTSLINELNINLDGILIDEYTSHYSKTGLSQMTSMWLELIRRVKIILIKRCRTEIL